MVVKKKEKRPSPKMGKKVLSDSVLGIPPQEVGGTLRTQRAASSPVQRSSLSRTLDVVAPDYDVSKLQQLMGKLLLAPETIVNDAATQPLLFLSAARIRVANLRKLNAAKAALDLERSSLALKLREEARDAGDKMTEGNLSNLLDADSDVNALQSELHAATELDEFTKLLVEAFRMRRDCLRTMGDVTNAERVAAKLRAQEAADMAEVQSSLRKKYPGA